jgi:hypothetical protein
MGWVGGRGALSGLAWMRGCLGGGWSMVEGHTRAEGGGGKNELATCSVVERAALLQTPAQAASEAGGKGLLPRQSCSVSCRPLFDSVDRVAGKG